MDSLGSNSFDIHDAFCRYRIIRLGKLCLQGKEGSKDLLAQFSQIVESSINADSRISIFDEIRKLMSRLNLMADFSEFSCFYDFVYFICRENGQKNITVNKAVEAWRLILAGRFRLLNQWCEFVEKNQRHNISEDTWRQVLAFSRCVHENLEGYDPEGAWPVLIDDFVEHMYSVSGRNENTNAMDSQSCVCDDSLPGLKCLPGLKRKCPEDMETDDGLSSLITTFPNSTNLNSMTSFKRNKSKLLRSANGENNFIKCNNSSRPSPCSTSQCAIEGCLSRGFSGSFSALSCSQLKRERRVQFRKSYKPTGGEKILPRVI